MTNPKVDDLSMMTYLSQFPQAKLKPGAPLRPKVNPNRWAHGALCGANQHAINSLVTGPLKPLLNWQCFNNFFVHIIMFTFECFWRSKRYFCDILLTLFLFTTRVRAYGPGLEPKGNTVGAPAKFTVETFSAGKGNLDILVLDPKGKQMQVGATKWLLGFDLTILKKNIN